MILEMVPRISPPMIYKIKHIPEVCLRVASIISDGGHYRQAYCEKIRDIRIVWSYLATTKCLPKWQFHYCKYVKDRKEVRSALARSKHPTAPHWQLMYCKHIKDRNIMWRALARNPNATAQQLEYCFNVNKRCKMLDVLKRSITKTNDPELWYTYCDEIEDEARVWKLLAESTTIDAPYWQYMYCHYVKDREEMWRALLSHNFVTERYYGVICQYVEFNPRPEAIEIKKALEEMLFREDASNITGGSL